ncbi:MAG: hypothetical protein ABII79_03785 [bacterium]
MITTPRGMRIQLPLDHSFCLMSRLYPKIKPYSVLETAAGFYKMHGTVACVTGILCFLLQLTAWQTGCIVFIATLAGYFMSVFAIYPPGLLRLALIYSLLTGYGLILVGLSVVGIVTVGLTGTGVFWASRLLAEFVTMGHANYLGRKIFKVTNPEAYAMTRKLSIGGAPDGFAIRCFGNAYATYASKLGAPIEAVASAKELESSKWRNVLNEFVQEWPQIAKRFQVTDEKWAEILQGNH